MKEYIEPEIEIIEYELLDIIAQSMHMQSETKDSFEDKTQSDPFDPEKPVIDNNETFIDD